MVISINFKLNVITGLHEICFVSLPKAEALSRSLNVSPYIKWDSRGSAQLLPPIILKVNILQCSLFFLFDAFTHKYGIVIPFGHFSIYNMGIVGRHNVHVDLLTFAVASP